MQGTARSKLQGAEMSPRKDFPEVLQGQLHPHLVHEGLLHEQEPMVIMDRLSNSKDCANHLLHKGLVVHLDGRGPCTSVSLLEALHGLADRTPQEVQQVLKGDHLHIEMLLQITFGSIVFAAFLVIVLTPFSPKKI